MILRSIGAILLAVQSSTVAVPVPQPNCVTRQQIGDAAITVLPNLIDRLSEQCRRHLGEDAFLRAGAADMSARMREVAESRREGALRALGHSTIIGGQRMRSGEEAYERITVLVNSGFNNVDAKACGDANTLFEDLSVLGPDRISRLIGALVGLVGAGRAPVGMLCEE